MKKLLGVILLSLLITGCGGALPPPPSFGPTATMTSTMTPSATPTVTLTATPTPTIDYLATYTYTIPVSATPTPDQCDQQELTTYRDQLIPIRDEFMDQVDAALALRNKLANATIPSFSDVTEVGTIYFRMTELTLEAQGLAYPPCAEPVQAKFIQGLNSYAGAIKEMADYYTGKGGNLNAVDGMIGDGRRLLMEAVDELDNLVER